MTDLYPKVRVGQDDTAGFYQLQIDVSKCEPVSVDVAYAYGHALAVQITEQIETWLIDRMAAGEVGDE